MPHLSFSNLPEYTVSGHSYLRGCQYDGTHHASLNAGSPRYSEGSSKSIEEIISDLLVQAAGDLN